MNLHEQKAYCRLILNALSAISNSTLSLGQYLPLLFFYFLLGMYFRLWHEYFSKLTLALTESFFSIKQIEYFPFHHAHQNVPLTYQKVNFYDCSFCIVYFPHRNFDYLFKRLVIQD